MPGFCTRGFGYAQESLWWLASPHYWPLSCFLRARWMMRNVMAVIRTNNGSKMKTNTDCVSIAPSVVTRQEMVGSSGIIPVDQFEECAVFTTALLHLIEQRKFVAVKSAEPLIPAKVLQLVFTGAAREIEAQHTP